jgi:hypothetical protein
MRILNIAPLALIALAARAETYQLKATPDTVAVGYYWSEAKPALKIKSGDTVEMETVSGSADKLAQLGVPASQIPPALEKSAKTSRIVDRVGTS